VASKFAVRLFHKTVVLVWFLEKDIPASRFASRRCYDERCGNGGGGGC